MALSENRSGKEVPHRYAAELRRELSARNLERAKEYAHEQTYGQVPRSSMAKTKEECTATFSTPPIEEFVLLLIGEGD